jgi:proteic killer suppression protein
MIRSFRHKGIERFFLTGSKAGIQPKYASKLADQLTALNIATTPEQMRVPGWNLHLLQGELAGHWSLTVSGSWRITLTFEGEDAVFVDDQDYH